VSTLLTLGTRANREPYLLLLLEPRSSLRICRDHFDIGNEYTTFLLRVVNYAEEIGRNLADGPAISIARNLVVFNPLLAPRKEAERLKCWVSKLKQG